MARKKIDIDPEMEFPVEQDSFAFSDTEADAPLFPEDTAAEVNMAPMDDPSDLPDSAQAAALNTLLAHTLDSGLELDLEQLTGLEPAADNMPADADTPDASIGELGIELELEREIAELDGDVQGRTEQDGASNELAIVHEADMLPAKVKDSSVSSVTPAQVPSNQPAQFRQTTNFFQTDFKRLDRDLTEPQREEWNAIYASYRARSILTGTVQGVDQNELPVKNPETGRTELRVITSLVVIGYRVKVLIPESEVWVRGEERGAFLLRSMLGATVDYVIISVDREGECAIASRSSALSKRRRAFAAARNAPQPGDLIKCNMMVVGPKRCLLTYAGYDVPQRVSDMSYTPILDMREVYRPGQEFTARLLGLDLTEHRLRLSVKEASPHPFEGAERRHPVGSRRQAVIQGKYAGGVFCVLPDDTICFCLYSNALYDTEFLLGDNVIVHIAQYDYRNRFIYGRIVTKW